MTYKFKHPGKPTLVREDWRGKQCALIHDETGEPVSIHDTLTTSRGEAYRVTGGAAPHKPSSTGRVYTTGGEYFPSVFGCTWRAEQ